MLDSQGEVMALASIYLGIPQCSQDREQLTALERAAPDGVAALGLLRLGHREGRARLRATRRRA